MPLLLLCGYPCSGKSLVATRLAGLLREQDPDYVVEVISEETIARAISPNISGEQDPRVAIFANVSLEKQLRSQIKSQTDRILSSKKGSSALCVLVDANNYIKGYRYEMYCVAKATRQQQAIVYCTTPEAMCRANNAQTARYPEEIFTDLVNRFERPNGTSRWDNPLYEICLPKADGPFDPREEFKQLVEDLASRVIRDLLQSNVKVKPNQSTVPSKSAAADYIQTVERATNKVISLILTAQSRGDEKVALPNQEDVVLQLAYQETWTPAILAKAKRHFFAFVRSGLGASADTRVTRRTSEDEISALFVRFLGTEAQQLASLT
ncbi:protein KTI12 [Echinococcus multilocularis]|uniref:Protein KTI12 homolog n=1 Tax=Echinococcus multilocularis TaxID=6211 RepID=A0A068YKK5_ECHMU|nr:protein KTI12 [Echinococcus multilocularis]